MDLCLVLLLSSTAYDRLLRSPVSCAHLRVTCEMGALAGVGQAAQAASILFASLIQTLFQGHLRQRALLIVPLQGTRLTFAISKQVNGDSRLGGGHTNLCRA